MTMRFRPSLILPISALLLTPVASADFFWNEAVDGDLSNDRLAPNAFLFFPGTHSLLATTGGGNLDYLSITVPAGAQFTELRLTSYQGDDETAFVAVQSGAVFTEAPDFPDQANLLGWAHFGPFNIDTDILDDIGGGFGSIGFTPPLPSGTYTFWLQQLGGPVSYQMDFTIIPAPTAAVLLFIGAATTGGRRRR
jgi:hypothetical protein